MWTFAIEEALINKALTNSLNVGGGLPKALDSWDEVVAAFKQNHADAIAALESARTKISSGR